MTESIDHQKLAEAIAALGELAQAVSDQWATALDHAFGNMPSVTIPDPRPTTGSLFREMEWKVKQLEETRDKLVDDVAERDRRIAGLNEQVNYWHDDAEGLRGELTDLRKTHHDWVNGQRTKEPTLSESIQRINDVVTMQIESLSPTSGTGRVVDIRRRMLAKYPIQHDADHLGDPDHDLVGAAIALIRGNTNDWPWSVEKYNEIVINAEQLPTAAALLIAHYDAMRQAGQES